MKRWFTTLMALTLALSCASALAEEAGFNAEGLPICSGPITISVVGLENSGLDWENQYLTHYVKEKLGIQMDFTLYTSNDWDTQFTLMLSTQTLPDLFIGVNSDKAKINEYGADGILLDLSDYADLMPNYQALCEQYPQWAAYQRTTDGSVYGLSRLFPSRLGLATGLNTFVNLEWLENLNLDMPTTLDEFYDMLVAFKEEDANGNGDPNDEIPLCIQIDVGRGTRLEWLLFASFGFYTNNTSYTRQADAEGNVYLAQTTDAYKEYLKFMHKLYEEELLDATCFIQTDDERIDKVRNNLAGVFSDYSGLQVAVGGGDGSLYEKYAFLTGLSSPYNDKVSFPLGNCGYAEGARTFVNANTEYPEAIVRLIDHFLSEDSVLLCDYGVEGETFSFVTDSLGHQVPSFDGYWEEQYESATAYQNTLKLDEGLKLIRTSYLDSIIENSSDEELDQMIFNDPSFTYTSNAAIEKALRSADELVSPFPDLLYTEEEASERSTLAADISAYLRTMKASFIMGEMDIDANWDSYLAELESMGLNELLAIEQAAYDRLIG